MTTLAPVETLLDTDRGNTLPMPPELAMIYGKLQFPPHEGRPYVIGNFVETLDGVTSLNVPGQSGGSEISGGSQQDRMLMGLLRSASDAAIVGAGTLRAVPHHLWTGEYIFPPLAEAYRDFRKLLGKAGLPLNVIVSGSGALDPRLPVFTSGDISTLIVTNSQGLQEIHKLSLPSSSVQVESVTSSKNISARAILLAVNRIHQSELVLVEGGPRLIGYFLAEGLLDELFLTLAPQVAGRDDTHQRPALVEGTVFAPEHSLWSRLVSVKRADDHLFLRYAFDLERQSGNQ
ncbi:MAG: dihydrofolate reductase family protein [Chloroflexi bacterium]|nr:dihydrofolate reductase family protein [Chloroflexota bacterium]